MVEYSSDEILEGADIFNIAFLVVGDPFGYHTPFQIKLYPSRTLIQLY